MIAVHFMVLCKAGAAGGAINSCSVFFKSSVPFVIRETGKAVNVKGETGVLICRQERRITFI